MSHAFTTSLPGIAGALVKRLGVKVTPHTIKEALQSSPDYPTLLSLNQAFDKYNITNSAYRLEPEHFDELEPPYVAYISGTPGGDDFVLVTAQDEATVTYSETGKNSKTVSKTAFLKQWKNIAWFAEPDEKSGDHHYAEQAIKEKRKTTKRWLLLLAAAAIPAWLVFFQFYQLPDQLVTPAAILLLTKSLGLAVTGILLLYEIDKSNVFVKNICSAGRQTNCDAVLNSKAGKIMGISWAEAGFFYFAATTIFLLFPGTNAAAKWPLLSFSAVAVSPYIIFSLYYQYRVVKQWCPLCLAVQAVLALELVWAIIQLISLPLINPFLQPATILPALIISILLPVAMWYAVKPLLKNAKSANQYQHAYKRLLYNPDYFNHLLQKEETVADGWADLGIIIGNPTAQHTILKVCNPYCGPCAKAHPELEDIIRHNNNIKLQVIFTATNSDADSRAEPVRHLLAIAGKGNADITAQALDDWYMAPKKDYAAFAARYPLNGELKQQGEKIEAMSAWCEKAAIHFTPTIFINGKKLPENYNISELKNIL